MTALTPILAAEPLTIGELAPAFSLQSPSGETVSREQFRGRYGLLLLFAPDLSLGPIAARLKGIAAQAERYTRLQVRLFVITSDSAHLDLAADLTGVTVLLDPDSKTWQAYSQTTVPGYGLFFLDRYGGVDSQLVVSEPEALPNSDMALEWARYTMYKCIC